MSLAGLFQAPSLVKNSEDPTEVSKDYFDDETVDLNNCRTVGGFGAHNLNYIVITAIGLEMELTI